MLLLPVGLEAATGAARRLDIDGLPVYLQPAPGGDVLMRAYIRAGREAAGEGSDLADLTAAWLVAGGTRSLPGAEFAAALKALDLRLTARAERDLLTVDAWAPRANFRPAARLLADLILYPAFDPGVESTARKRAAANGAPALDTLVAQGLAIDAPPRPPPPARRRPIGDVAAFAAARVGIDTTVLVVVGAIEGIDVERELRAAFVGFRRAGDPILPRATDGAVGRGFSIAQRESEPGLTRLVVARRGLHVGHPDWLALELGIVAGLLDAGIDRRAESYRLRIEQGLLMGDLVMIDAVVATAAVESLVERASRSFAALRNRDLDSDLLERARAVVARSLVPPPSAGQAVFAHALLEAFGRTGAEPLDRYQELESIDRAQVIRALARHLRE